MSNNSGMTIELMKTFTKQCRTTCMSRHEERIITKKLATNGLEKKYPLLLKSILSEAKDEYVKITQEASVVTKIKSDSYYKLEPYKYLGKTKNYSNYLKKRQELSKKWLLNKQSIRGLLEECVLNLPYELFTITIDSIMEFDEFQTLLNCKVSECEKVLGQFHNKVQMMLKNDGTLEERCMRACTGLLSVHLSRSIAHTLLHVVNFTYNKQVPYIKLNITFNDGLILKPTKEEIIDMYKRFLNNVVKVGKQLRDLDRKKNKTIYLCLTKEFCEQCEKEIERSISTLYEPISNYINDLNRNFNELYSCIQTDYIIDIISRDIVFEIGCNQLNYYKNYLNRILFIPDNVYFNFGKVCLKNYRTTLCDGMKIVINTIFNKLCEQHYWEVNDICEKYQLIYVRANQSPLTTEQLIETGKFMIDIKENQLNELTSRVYSMLKLLIEIMQLGHLSEDHIEVNSLSINWPKKIAPIIDEYFIVYDQLKFDAEEKLQKVVEDLNGKIQDVYPLLVILDDMDDITKSELYLNEIILHMTKIKLIEEEISWINKEELCLSFPKTIYTEFNDLKNYVYPFYHLLKICVKIQRNLSVWLDGNFEQLIYNDIKENVEIYSEELNDIQKNYRKSLRQAQDENVTIRFRGTVDDPDILNWPAPLKLCTKAIQLIDNFRPYMRIIEIMCNQALKSRHWKAMSIIAEYDITPNAGTTLRKIMETDLKSDLNKYEIISIGATKEKLLYDELIELKNQWFSINFNIVYSDKNESYIISDLEEIETLIDEQCMKLINMRGSVYIQPHENHLRLFSNLIETIRKFVNRWKLVQSQWCLFHPIFQYDHQIAVALQTEYELFKIVDKVFKQYTEQWLENPNVLCTIEKSGILNDINDCTSKLEIIKKGVENYLEKIRDAFKRFYLLSNNELILILSESKDLHNIQPYLNKFFVGIDNLIYENVYIKGIVSEMGEKVFFNNSINTEIETLVEERMKYVELYMMEAIEKQIYDCYQILKGIDLRQLVEKYPQQIVQVVNEINWTELIEGGLNRGENFGKMIDTEKCVQQKLQLIKANDLSELTKHKLKNLILMDFNKRDYEMLYNINDFKWATQLKYSLINNLCVIKFMHTHTKYMHEYLGNIDEIVLTPSTDRCIRALLNTFYLHMNGLLRGKTQTGKLTTLKKLSHIFAVLLINFNCIHYQTYSNIERLINGMTACGCWLVLKNFDHLTCEFLSIFSQCMNVINAYSTRMNVKQTFFLTATINNDKFQLPEYVNCLFRTSILLMPDLQMIIEILLESRGYNDTKILAKKIVAILKLIEDIENNLFGIKAIKLILFQCELLKTSCPDMNESVIVGKSVENVIKRQLRVDNVDMLETIIKTSFGIPQNVENTLNEDDEECLVSVIKNVCEKSNLDPKQSFVMKIVQTLDLIKSRYGQILVGETYSGKSTAIKMCSKIFAHQQQYHNSGNEIKYHIINIKCLTYKQLYGNFNSITQQWEDGILTKMCRQNEYNWILLDGQPNYVCIENLNSILDEKKILYLTSGEQIHINQLTIFIEIDKLDQFSPATISRCAIVYYGNAALTWQSLVKSWLLNNAELTNKFSNQILNLLNWIAPACLNFLNNNNYVQQFWTSDCNFVVNLLHLLRMALENMLAELKEDDGKNVQIWLQAAVLQSGVWAFGSALEDDSRQKFDVFYKNLWKGNIKEYCYPSTMEKLEITLPQEGTMYDYYYLYKQRGSWKSWSDLLKSEKIFEGSVNGELFIPTIDTIRYTNLIKNHIKCERAILITGETGTGKSFLMNDILENKLNKEEYQITSINAYQNLTTNQLQKFVLNKMNRTKGGNYVTTNNRCSVIFIDDLNLLSLSNESHPVIELIRSHLDHDIWYDLNNFNKIHLKNAYFTVCANLMYNRREQLCPRFLRHFSIFAINQFCQESVSRIYSNVLHTVWKRNAFPADIQAAINTIVKSTYHIYNEIKRKFKATVNKPQYIFNLSDISKVIYGIGRLKKETYDANKKIYVKLWLHEIDRIFGDRINNIHENETFLQCVENTIKEHFKEELDELLVENVRTFINDNRKVLFGSLFHAESDQDFYEEMQEKQLEEFVSNQINEYNARNKYKLNIILFEYALEYLVKICRLLSQSHSNGLLIGLNGTGRQTLSKLASFIYKHHLYHPIITNEYNINKFTKDVRFILKECGAFNKRCVFLLNEEHILCEEFLQIIDSISTNNDIANIFYNCDEKQEILQLVRVDASQKHSNNAIDINMDDVYSYFNKRTKANLHILLCLNINTLKDRMFYYMSFKKFNIIWFNKWPDVCLNKIANKFLNETNLNSDIKTILSSTFLHIHNEMETHLDMPLASCKYLNYLNLYLDIIKMKEKSIRREKEKYVQGLDKLSSGEEQITAMQTALGEYQPQLEEMTLKAIEMTKQIALDTIQVEKASALVRKDEKIAHEQAEVAQILKLECEAELAQAIPILEDAISALNTLKPSDITLVKSMKNPPDAIKLVMAAVCVIKDVKPDRIPDPSTGRKLIDYWGPSKRILGDMNFLQSLKEFDKDNIKVEIMYKIRKEYLPHKDFKPNVVAKASSAAEGLCKWIIAMDMYDKVAKEVAPKKEKLEMAEKEYATTMAILNQKKEQVARIEEKLAALNALLEDATRKQKHLQQQVDLCNEKLFKAQQLIGGLSEEKVKWTQTVEILLNQFETLPGDVLLSATLITYMGLFNNHKQKHVYSVIFNYIKTAYLPFNVDNYNFITNLKEDLPIEYWLTEELPNDNNIISNILIYKYTKQFSLFIDPQQQAYSWIKNIEKGNQLIVSNFTKPNILYDLKQCIISGVPILIQIFEENIPHYMYTLLNKQLFHENNTTYIQFNNETIKYNNNFRLYLITMCKNHNIITPEMYKLVTIINFELSQHVLSNILMKIVIETERPEYKAIQEEINSLNAKCEMDFKHLNEKILNTLTKSQNDLLEDEDAIKILDDSKRQLREIETNRSILKERRRIVDEFKKNYENYVNYVTCIYDCVYKLQNIHCMYQFSLDWYKNLYLGSILNSRKSKCSKLRSEYLMHSFSYDLYKNVVRSLFEKDKLLFTFTLSVTVLIKRGLISFKEYEMFVNGPRMFPVNKNYRNPISNLITEYAWNEFCLLEHLPKFQGFINSFCENIDYWRAIFDKDIFNENTIHTKDFTDFQKLLILRFIKSDFLYGHLMRFIENTLGKEFLLPIKVNMNEIYNESYNLSPIIFILSNDLNPIDKIQTLVNNKKLQNKYNKLSLNCRTAKHVKELMKNAQNEGLWILLENCDLNPSYLRELEENLTHNDNINENFRLFLTTKPTNQFPKLLLQNSIKIIDEQPKNFKYNLLKFYQDEPLCNAAFFYSCPGKHTIFTKCIFAICYFHIMLIERKKYLTNLNVPYYLTKSTLNNACKQIHSIINETNFDVKYLGNFLLENNYSEFIYNEMDLFELLMKQYLNGDHINNKDNLFDKFCFPLKNDYQDYINHIGKLTDDDLPQIIELNNYVKYNYWRHNTFVLLHNLQSFEMGQIQHTELILFNKINDIASILPDVFIIDKTITNVIILNEYKMYNKIINILKTTVFELNEFLTNTKYISLHVTEILNDILNNKLPNEWRKHSNTQQTNLILFFKELNEYCEYFRNNSQINNSSTYWLAPFYNPKALLCYQKLTYSKNSNISYESIKYKFDIILNNESNLHANNIDKFIITGLYIRGARWTHEENCLTKTINKLYNKMPLILCRMSGDDGSVLEERPSIHCPLYHLNNKFIENLQISIKDDAEYYIKNSVALFTQVNSHVDPF